MPSGWRRKASKERLPTVVIALAFANIVTFLPFNEFPVSLGEVMDELSSSLGPYEIGMGVGSAHLLLSAIALRVKEGAVAGTALG